MDIQKFVDDMNKLDQRTRSGYHLTLGGLIKALRNAPEDMPVRFDDGRNPGCLDSYRGYYVDLALSQDESPITCGELSAIADDAVGGIFQGYKGGDFTMDEDTPLWAAEYGDLGSAIMDAKIIDGVMILMTKQVD